MWRFLFLTILVTSLSLNVYLLVPIKQPSIVKAAFSDLVRTAFSAPKTSQVTESTEVINVNVDKTQALANGLPMLLSTHDGVKPPRQRVKNLEEIIQQSIDAQEYFLASNLLYEIPLEDQLRLSTLKSYWLSNAMQLLKNKHYLLAENAINAFLAYAPDDLDFLRAVVKLRLAQQQILLAIKKALSLEYHTFDLDLQQQILNYAQALVRDEIKRLFELALWLELAQFTEEVLAMVPNSAQAQWALAQAQFQLGDYSFARQNLTALIEQPNYQVKAQRLFNTIELALQRPEMVPLIRNGDHFIVEGLINNNFSVDLLIDTGASISVLSQGVFDELVSQSKVKYIEDIVLTTAGGEVDSRIYQVEEFALQGYQVNNLLFAVIPYKGQKNDGLLGMNYLRLFDFHIDQSNNLLRLENKP